MSSHDVFFVSCTAVDALMSTHDALRLNSVPTFPPQVSSSAQTAPLGTPPTDVAPLLLSVRESIQFYIVMFATQHRPYLINAIAISLQSSEASEDCNHALDKPRAPPRRPMALPAPRMHR
jgi:hypothetical protein